MLRWTVPIVALVGTVRLAHASSPPDASVFSSLSLEEAIEESKRTSKLLIVYPRGQGAGYDQMDRHTWTNPALRLWLMQHAIVVRIDQREDPHGYARFVGAMRARGAPYVGGSMPQLLIFRRGRLERTIPDEEFQGFFWEPNPVFGGQPDPGKFYPKAVQVLFQLDFFMEKLRATDPVWHRLHEERNPPPPPPPEPPPLYLEADHTAEAVPDPPDGSAPDPMGRLRAARAAAAAGELHRATGLYTWLWERMDRVDPALRPARLTIVASEMADLAAQRPASRERFDALRSRLLERRPWWTLHDEWEWVVLCRVVADEGQALEFMAMDLHDPQQAAMLPPSERAAWLLMASAPGMTLAWPLDRRPGDAEWLRRQVRELGEPEPKAEAWRHVRELRRQLVVDRPAASTRRGWTRAATSRPRPSRRSSCRWARKPRSGAPCCGPPWWPARRGRSIGPGSRTRAGTTRCGRRSRPRWPSPRRAPHNTAPVAQTDQAAQPALRSWRARAGLGGPAGRIAPS